MSLKRIWSQLTTVAGLGLAFTMSGLVTPELASAQSWHWETIQNRAYLVENRSEDLYEEILQEARPGRPDEEYALQLSYEMAAQAHRFSYEVDRYAWMLPTYTSAEFHRLYNAYYRLNEALRYNSFSYHVNQIANELSLAMSYLSSAYSYRFVHDGWYYVTYRDRWWRAGYRHHRDHYWRLRRDRIERRRAYRDHWYKEHRRRRPHHRPPVVPDRPNRRPIARPPRQPDRPITRPVPPRQPDRPIARPPRQPDRPITRPAPPRQPDRPIARPPRQPRQPDRPIARPPRQPDRPITRPDRPRRDHPVARPDRPSRGNDRGRSGNGRGRSGRRPR